MRVKARAVTVAIIMVTGALAASTGPAAAAPSPQTRPVSTRTRVPAGVMPLVHTGLASLAAPAGAHLTYYGGHVISNVQVVQVLYGSGTYTPEVSSPSTGSGTSIASFYTGVTNSIHFDWLSEYNTNITAAGGQPGTNQGIGRGSFVGQVQILPAASNNGATIDDVNIKAELKAQIRAGHLPSPNANTIYTVYFPANKTITQGGTASGVAFCAYHGTVAASSGVPEFYYSVLPDFTTGGMTSGCGGGTRFQNETSVSSHELVEAVTDAEVGLATVSAPPLAWYDNTNGEIGDICNAQQATITGGDGKTYTVQKEFSNVQNNCVATGPTVANDFSISTSPSSLTVAAGSSGPSTVSTAVTSGSAGTVSLSASGQPSGVAVTLSPTSVTAGGSSTLTVSTTTGAAAGTYSITVKGTEGSATHSAALSLTVTTGGGGGGGGLTNGGFETGTLAGWTSSGATSVVSSGAQAGTYAARVGATTPSGDSSIAETFTVPAGGTGISFWYNVTCPDTVTYDWATATVKDNTTGVTTTVLPNTCVNPSSGWKAATAAVTAGHSVTLTLSSHDDNYAGDPTYTLYDSVAVTSQPAPTGGITNGGFETGTLNGWTAGGARAAITTTAHSGAYSAQLGNTSATNGDSTLSQTFVAPGGTTQLGLWYANSCPDTVTYDWVTVTLRDNTTGTTVTVVPKVCAASYVWTAKTAAVTTGHNYTLTLSSHDDNYSSDPTFTLFDDITLG